MPDTGRGLFGKVGGFLSKLAEWHALAIGAGFGILIGLFPEPSLIVFFGLVVTGKAAHRNGHLRDAAEEVAYTLGAFVLTVAPTFALSAFVG